mgnify:CR=1 FL=1
MCEVLGVSTSGYYHWKEELRGGLKTNDLDAKIVAIFEKSRRTYGSPRVFKFLRKSGTKVSESTVSRRMRALGITPVIKKRFKSTTDSKHDLPIAQNILNREFTVAQTGRVWVGDITYIPVQDSFVYLTTVIDLADRMVVGWKVSDNMTDTDTTIAAFEQALKNRPIAKGLLFHSDRGSQYASGAFRKLLAKNHCIQSMSRKGNCWDNAVAESFFKTIKTESLQRYQFTNMNQVYSTVFHYIDGWYNTLRIHTSLGDKSPREMFLQLDAKKLAA